MTDLEILLHQKTAVLNVISETNKKILDLNKDLDSINKQMDNLYNDKQPGLFDKV